MSKLYSQACPNCPTSFTQHNPPRQLINCQHLMCQRCLISQKSCQKCGAQVGLQDHFLKDYPIVNILDIPKCQPLLAESKGFSYGETDKNTIHEDHSQLLNQSCEKQQQKGQQVYVEQCLLHFKPADLICLDDHAIICSSCALFGKHKGHQISNRQGILTKFATFVQSCLKIYDQLKVQNKQFSSHSYRAQYQKILLEKKQNDQRRTSEKFESLISMIKIIEKKQLLRINQFYKEKQKIYDLKLPRIQKTQGEIRTWMAEIENIGALMSDTNNLQKLIHCVPYIDQKSQIKRDVINKGTILIQRLNETKNLATIQLSKEKNSDILKFDEQKVKFLSTYVSIKNQQANIKRAQSISKASGFCPPKSPVCCQQNSMKFKSSSKKQHLKTQSDAYEPNISQKLRSDVTVNCFNQDNLLLSVENTVICIKTQERKDVYIDRVQIAEQLDVESIPQLSISDIRPVTTMSSGQSSDQSRFLHRDRQLRQFVNDNLSGFAVQIAKDDSKRKKKNDFPEKFKGSVDDLKSDRAETIDLTGAQVGDASILSLCQYIRKTKKLKTLKLVKNKLTDECLGELLEALAESKVCSLNLSQNLLTDKSCQIISSSPISQHLKTITLSLNKVNRRNVKAKIDQLGKKNIALLL